MGNLEGLIVGRQVGVLEGFPDNRVGKDDSITTGTEDGTRLVIPDGSCVGR